MYHNADWDHDLKVIISIETKYNGTIIAVYNVSNSIDTIPADKIPVHHMYVPFDN